MLLENEISNDQFLDEITSNAFGRDFKNSLRKTYSRRSKRDKPKTFGEKAKRLGGLIPIVALGKAGIEAARKRKAQRRGRGNTNYNDQGPPRRQKGSGNPPTPRRQKRSGNPPTPRRQKGSGTPPLKTDMPNKRYSEPLIAPIGTIPNVLKKEPMSKGLKIGLIAGGVALLLVTGVIIYKKTR